MTHFCTFSFFCHHQQPSYNITLKTYKQVWNNKGNASHKKKPVTTNSNNTLRFFNKGLCPRVKAQLNQVALDGSSNDVPPVKAKSDVEPPTKASIEPSSSVLENEEAISQFFVQVASLVKLVDSRDIEELKLKRLNYEVTIKKKEVMPQPQYAPPPAVTYSPQFQTAPPVAPSYTQVPPTPSPPTSLTVVKKPSRPPLKSPMAGTFYRCPAPGEPPFVKVGDKVTERLYEGCNQAYILKFDRNTAIYKMPDVPNPSDENTTVIEQQTVRDVLENNDRQVQQINSKESSQSVDESEESPKSEQDEDTVARESVREREFKACGCCSRRERSATERRVRGSRRRRKTAAVFAVSIREEIAR